MPIDQQIDPTTIVTLAASSLMFVLAGFVAGFWVGKKFRG